MNMKTAAEFLVDRNDHLYEWPRTVHTCIRYVDNFATPFAEYDLQHNRRTDRVLHVRFLSRVPRPHFSDVIRLPLRPTSGSRTTIAITKKTIEIDRLARRFRAA